MSITNLDLDVLKTALAGAWRKELNTTEDPANGQWYVDGANHDGIGLYGNLSDAVPTGLVFDQSKLVYLPQEVVCMSALVDNRNGLTPNSTVTLAHAYASSTTTTHTITNALKLGAAISLKAGVNLEVVEGDVTMSMSVDYTFTYSFSTSSTESKQQTFSQAVPVSVPTGKIYKVLLTASAQQIQVPFTAYVVVSGTTETWFNDRVNGHYNWSTNAGAAFAWIAQFGTAGDDSASYGPYPQDPSKGAVTIRGVLNHQSVGDFQAVTYDVTPTSAAAVVAPSAVRAVKPGAPVSEGILVSKKSMS